MTGVEMNAPARKNLSRAAGVAAIGLLAGCAAPFHASTDPASPLSQRVDELVQANREYPRWEDFPPAPEPPPSQAVVAASVGQLGREADALGAQAAAIDWTLSDAEGFARSTRDRAAAPVSEAVARTAAEVEAFARSLRERATAPAPIDPQR